MKREKKEGIERSSTQWNAVLPEYFTSSNHAVEMAQQTTRNFPTESLLSVWTASLVNKRSHDSYGAVWGQCWSWLIIFYKNCCHCYDIN